MSVQEYFIYILLRELVYFGAHANFNIFNEFQNRCIGSNNILYGCDRAAIGKFIILMHVRMQN